ncbi:hypothetical protein B0H12DRAFT_1126198 [Mycena haematopus]|nr:hypothetical protein B0H12DRAFT_1126198 [Mycena haematopus]
METELFRTLLSTTHRWRHVIWDIPYLSPLCDLQPGSFEALEHFTIENMDFRGPTKSIDVFQSALRLREVAIRIEGRKPYILSLFRIPWNQLTSLTLEDALSVEDCRDVILQCTNMLSLKIRCSCLMVGWDMALTPSVVVLPFLHTLEFHVWGLVQAAIGHFFAYLALPALKSFKLSLESPLNIRWDVGLFSEFQDRSPNIKEIAVGVKGRRIDVENLIALLRHSPTVTGLVIDGCPIDDVFLHNLEVHDNDRQVLAPNLVDLEFDGTRLSASALETMIRSRWRDSMIAAIDVPHVASLKKVVVNHSSQELETKLKALRLDEGFDLHFYR